MSASQNPNQLPLWTSERDAAAQVQVFLDLDPVLLENFADQERIAVTVNAKALHDLMLAYQILQINRGVLEEE